MKLHFDEQADAVFIKLDENKSIKDSREVEKGVILDFDENDQVVGIEILKVKSRIGMDQLKEVKFQVAD